MTTIVQELLRKNKIQKRRERKNSFLDSSKHSKDGLKEDEMMEETVSSPACPSELGGAAIRSFLSLPLWAGAWAPNRGRRSAALGIGEEAVVWGGLVGLSLHTGPRLL